MSLGSRCFQKRAEIRTSLGSTTVIGGSATGAGPYTGDGTVYFEGDLRPGNSPGTVSFGGNVVLGTTSTTQIELGETSDQLLVDGNASLDGELNVELLGDFTPDHGDQFPVITAGTRDGEFDTIDGIQVAADLTLAPIYDYAGHIGLMLIAAAPGDANGDGVVDVADLGILGANFNATDMQWNTGDFNLDSITNVSEEDGFAVSFNGHPVPTAAMRLRHGYYKSQVSHADDSALMIYPLDPAWIVIGKNNVEVKLTKSNQAVPTAMQLVGIEVQFDYRQIPIQVATD